MQNKPWKLAPLGLPTGATNIVNPPTITGGTGVTESKTYILITRIGILNKDTVARTFSAWIGATGGSAAGTEFIGSAVSLPANSYTTVFSGRKYLKTSDFLTMLASAITTLVVDMDGEIGLAD